jgi:hypothetical protein
MKVTTSSVGNILREADPLADRLGDARGEVIIVSAESGLFAAWQSSLGFCGTMPFESYLVLAARSSRICSEKSNLRHAARI